jgi:hypothetical protein
VRLEAGRLHDRLREYYDGDGLMPEISQPSQFTLPAHARHRLRGVGLAKLIEKATSGQLLRHFAQ